MCCPRKQMKPAAHITGADVISLCSPRFKVPNISPPLHKFTAPKERYVRRF